MIEPSKGRDDLDYRYHVTIETSALLSDMDQEAEASRGEDGYTSDPDFKSEFPALDWVKIETISFAEATPEKVRERLREAFGDCLKEDGVFVWMKRPVYVKEPRICRSSVHVRHSATVDRKEWE